MNLEFVKKDNWEVEFKADSNFNLHIEGVPEGQVRIYQRGTSAGEYAYVREATPYPSFADVYDFDFSALVYPKWIRVVCGNKPSVGVVTFTGDAPSGGGGTEIDLLTGYYLSEPQDVVWDASTEEGCKQAFETLWPLVERCGFEFFDNGGELSLKPWFKSLSITGGLEEADCNAIVNYKHRRDGVNYDFIVFNPYGEFALKKYYNDDGSVKSYSCGFFE